MTNPCMRKGGGTDVEQKATWRWRQRLELCSYEPGDQGLMAATNHGPAAPSEPLDRVNPADILISNFRLSGQREYTSVVSLSVCGHWLWQAVLWISPKYLVQRLCCLTAPLGIFSDHENWREAPCRSSCSAWGPCTSTRVGICHMTVSGVDESKQRQPPQSHTAVASAGSTFRALHIGEQVGKSLPRHRGVSQLVWGPVRPPPTFVQPVN